MAASLGIPVLGMPYPERDLAGNGYSMSRPASGRPVTFEDVVDLGHLVGYVVAPNAKAALRVDAATPAHRRDRNGLSQQI